MTGFPSVRRALAATAGALALAALPAATLAQTSDPELSCVPDTIVAGALTVALAGTSVAAPITVDPARPSGVSAGLGPSQGDVARVLPSTVLLALAVALAWASVPGLRRRATVRPGEAA